MKQKVTLLFGLLALLLSGCSKEYNCADLQIQPAFIGFTIADIDTFVIKKFKPNDNYQTLIDSFVVRYGYYGSYQTFHDTTTVIVTDGKSGIKAGYDWQLFIPAKNKTVLVIDIISEKKTGKCGSGIFSLDKFGCNCTNRIFTAKQDNQLISFSNSDTARHYIFIRN